MGTPDPSGKLSPWRSAVAILGGYVVIGVLVALTDQLWPVAMRGFSALPQPPAYYFSISLFTDFLYTIVGGWFTVRIAQRQPWRHAIGLIVLGELIGIATQIVLWNMVPHWYGVTLLILYPVGVWLGAKLGIGRQVGAHPVTA